jgi:hypothetical protein
MPTCNKGNSDKQVAAAAAAAAASCYFRTTETQACLPWPRQAIVRAVAWHKAVRILHVF